MRFNGVFGVKWGSMGSMRLAEVQCSGGDYDNVDADDDVDDYTAYQYKFFFHQI